MTAFHSLILALCGMAVMLFASFIGNRLVASGKLTTLQIYALTTTMVAGFALSAAGILFFLIKGT